jgi:hypothetical protein
MQELLDKLRAGYESERTDKDGVPWGNVYVANYLGKHDAGVLGALQKAGLYMPYDGGENMYKGVWGEVKLVFPGVGQQGIE